MVRGKTDRRGLQNNGKRARTRTAFLSRAHTRSPPLLSSIRAIRGTFNRFVYRYPILSRFDIHNAYIGSPVPRLLFSSFLCSSFLRRSPAPFPPRQRASLPASHLEQPSIFSHPSRISFYTARTASSSDELNSVLNGTAIRNWRRSSFQSPCASSVTCISRIESK